MDLDLFLKESCNLKGDLIVFLTFDCIYMQVVFAFPKGFAFKLLLFFSSMVVLQLEKICSMSQDSSEISFYLSLPDLFSGKQKGWQGNLHSYASKSNRK